jgi:uracil-DNA glycosylase
MLLSAEPKITTGTHPHPPGQGTMEPRQFPGAYSPILDALPGDIVGLTSIVQGLGGGYFTNTMHTTRKARALARHRRALGACQRCKLGAGIHPVASLASNPRAMLVGQAPGKVESEGGVPFSGRAGKTLFRWLARAGIDEATAREIIYISAVTRCYPGPHPSGRGDRVPTRVEQSSCADWLDDELTIIQPEVLIPVGRLAIERFLPDIPLSDLIGTRRIVGHVGGQSVVIPLPHPSGASSWVHQSDNKILLEKAIGLIAEALDSPRRPGSR